MSESAAMNVETPISSSMPEFDLRPRPPETLSGRFDERLTFIAWEVPAARSGVRIVIDSSAV